MASNFDMASNNSLGTNDDNTTELEAKYWTLRILASSIAEIAYAETPHPKVSPTTIEQLRNLLYSIDYDVSRKHLKSGSAIGGKGDGDLGESSTEASSVDVPVSLSHKPIELSTESQLVIKALISLSVQKLANTVLKLWNIERSSLKEKIHETSSSIDDNDLKIFIKLNTRLKEMKLEDEALDRDIEETEYIRMQEMLTYDKELGEVKEMMTELMGETLLKKKPQIMTSYIDHLKSQSELITTKIQSAKLQQQIDEHPAEIVDEFEKAFTELKSTVANKERECHELKDRLAKYESLGPELLEIATEYQNIEENIKTKEWVLQQLASASGDQSFDSSLF